MTRPLPPPNATGPDSRPGRWQRWQQRPRWQRRTVYAATAVVGLVAVGAALGDPATDVATERPTTEPDVSTTAASPTSPAPASTGPTNSSSPSSPPPATTPTTNVTTVPTTIPSTTVAPAPTTVPGALRALDVLAGIPVADEQPDGYDRDRFGYPADLDGNGCDTRADVLQRDSRTPAQVDPFGCQVLAGDWVSRYDGATHTDPAAVQIDHVVALKEAWDSGAWAWNPARLVAFGNDLDDIRSLRVVTAEVNSAKSDADPSNWLPPLEAAICPYLADHLE